MSRIELAMEKAARQREGRESEWGSEAAAPAESAGPDSASLPAAPRSLPVSPFLVNLHDPLSRTAEEYRKLKLALVEIATAHNLFRNVVMITSSVAKEGKTVTALNLAISLAEELEHRVLLIDADLRAPSLHRYLDMEQGVGLSDLLLDRAKLREAVVETGIGRLSILRAGTKVENPSELFTASGTKMIVEQLRHAFPDRYLIFDTSPVLPFAETRSLAHLVDGVLFVVMERIASQANVHEALESLKGCQIFGTVYNAAMLGPNEVYYSHYHPHKSSRGARQSQPAAAHDPDRAPPA